MSVVQCRGPGGGGGGDRGGVCMGYIDLGIDSVFIYFFNLNFFPEKLQKI